MRASAAIAGIAIRLSSIAGAGWGAFADRDLRSDEVLGDYDGTLVDATASGPYVLAIEGYDEDGRDVQMCIDAADPATSSWPRFINSVRQGDGRVVNCRFFLRGRHRPRRGEVCKVSVRTTRPIARGDELLLDYGNEYWDDDGAEDESGANGNVENNGPDQLE